MRAMLKRLHSPDVDIERYFPECGDSFGFLLQAMIGPEGSNAEEAFDFMVCTPKWLEDRYLEEKCIFGIYLIIVFDYDISVIRKKIEKLCSSYDSEDWTTIADKISKYGRWEFSDYRSK